MAGLVAWWNSRWLDSQSAGSLGGRLSGWRGPWLGGWFCWEAGWLVGLMTGWQTGWLGGRLSEDDDGRRSWKTTLYLAQISSGNGGIYCTQSMLFKKLPDFANQPGPAKLDRTLLKFKTIDSVTLFYVSI